MKFSGVVIVVVAMAIIYGGDVLGYAHQFGVQNQLQNNSVLLDCSSEYRSNAAQELLPGKCYVFSWFEAPPRAEDWICGFFWLGSTNIKQFAVYNHTQSPGGGLVCDICEWIVDSSGFSLKAGEVNKNQTGNHFMYGWETICLS
jgi:hypothetical protein